MQNQNNFPAHPVHLSDRGMIRVSGADAKSFLQNVMTNDIEKVSQDSLVYSCLLTPQGQFLHDFFVLQDPVQADCFIVDMGKTQIEDFLKRLTIFKLRAKVVLETLNDDNLRVYAVEQGGLKDPRLPSLGQRLYTQTVPEGAADDIAHYHAYRISCGVPDGSYSALQQRDFISDLNLDHLHAVAWDKGCFIGQEVAARMYHRGLAKKRMMVIAGTTLVAGQGITRDGRVMGEVRDVASCATQALALIRLDAVGGNILLETETGAITSINIPEYIDISAS